jgi:hypothetical protein
MQAESDKATARIHGTGWYWRNLLASHPHSHITRIVPPHERAITRVRFVTHQCELRLFLLFYLDTDNKLL